MSPYKCVGCEKELKTVHTWVMPSEQILNGLSAKLCKPCAHKITHSMALRKAVESRALRYAINDFLPELAASTGVPPATLQYSVIEQCTGDHDPATYALLDALFQLPQGTCLNAQSRGLTK